MKFAVTFANTIPFTEPGLAQQLAVAAENAGFESLWTVEHVIWPEAYDSQYPYHPSGKMPGQPSIPIPDPLIWLTWVGAVTTRIRLGTGILLLPERNPLVVGKELATLDHLSGGRMELGIGVGWLKEEFEALGIPWERRGARTDEYVAALRALWAGDGATFDGEFTSFREVTSNPKPVSGEIPITVGGHSRAAARRAARLGTGFYPGAGSVDDLRGAAEEMRKAAEEYGRDPAEIELSAGYPGSLRRDPEPKIEELRAIGVDRVMVPVFELARPDVETAMQRFAAEVMPLAG